MLSLMIKFIGTSCLGLAKLKYESKNADENPECINAVIIKNRHGERGTCALRWNGRFSRISDF